VPASDRAQAQAPTTLHHVVWELTLRCDLACNHCGSRAGKARGDELSTAEALDVVDQLADMGAKEVSLIGGEAYLREDWCTIIEAVRRKGMICTMVTGGRNMTPGRARDAARAGLQSASVSLDGMAPAHDLLRGVPGSYEAALAAASHLRDAGVEISINTQVNCISFDDLDAIFALAKERGFHSWQVQLTVPMGRAADNAEWLLQPDDILDVIPKIGALALAGRKAGVRLWPGNNLGYFGPHEDDLRGRLVKGTHYSGCSAGHRTLGIEADGAIKGCPSLPTSAYTGGNVRRQKILDIWRGTAELSFARERKVELWGRCNGCYYAKVCRGGCTWTAHVFFGRPGNNPYCHHRALQLDARGLRERIERVETAAGVPFDHGSFSLVELPARSAAERAMERAAVRTSALARRARPRLKVLD
jgi:radical SAM protein with 4Fe4S-binding SPASM domain